METWQRELDELREARDAQERAMLLRWFRRRPGGRGAAPEDDLDWVALYEVHARRGDPPTLVFPVDGAIGPGELDQESLVLVRGVTRPGRAVYVMTGSGDLEPAGRPRRPGRGDPLLVGER